MKFTTKVYNPLFLGARTLFYWPIIDSTEAKAKAASADPWATKWLSRHGEGWGAYTIASWQPGAQVTLVRNERYFGKPAAIRQVIMKEVPAVSNRLALLLSGQVDIAEDLGPRELRQVVSNHSDRVFHVVGNVMLYMGLNTLKKPLDNVRVRQAIALAVPYRGIIQGVYLGKARRFRSSVPLGFIGYSEAGWKWDTDLAKASQLLKNAGYQSGRKVKFALTYPSDRPQAELAAQFIKSNLAKIGIEVTLDKLSPARFDDEIITKRSEQAYITDAHALWFPDAGYVSELQLTSTGFGNFANFKNKPVDNLYKRAKVTRNSQRRLRLLAELQRIVNENVPYIPIALVGRPVAMKGDISGYTWYPTVSALRYHDLSIR